MCNLDLVESSDLDLVICLSAMTTHQKPFPAAPLQRALRSLFGLAAEQLDRQVAALRRRGVDVVVVEPTLKDWDAIGANLMDARRWGAVLEVALTSVAGQLRRRRISTRLGALHTAA